MGHLVTNVNPNAFAGREDHRVAEWDTVQPARGAGLRAVDDSNRMEADESDASQMSFDDTALQTFAGAEERSNAVPEVGVGDRVLYKGRPGWARAGREEFPADVMRVRDDGTLDLIVVYDRDDAMFEERVSFGEEGPCWTLTRQHTLLLDVSERFATLANLGADVDELRNIILGEYEAPAKPVLDYLSEFEDRIMEFRKELNDRPKVKGK